MGKFITSQLQNFLNNLTIPLEDFWHPNLSFLPFWVKIISKILVLLFDIHPFYFLLQCLLFAYQIKINYTLNTNYFI